MGVVAAPHEPVDADLVAGGDVGRPGEAHPHPHVLVEQLGGVLGQLVLVAVADLTGGAGVADAPDGAVEARQQDGHPRTAELGHHEAQAGEALEDAREDELHQRALGVEGRLGDVEQHRHRVRPVLGVAGAAVHGDGDPELLAQRPHGVVAGVVERRHPVDVGRQVGQQDAAAQAVLVDPADLGQGVVDVVEEDLADAGPALGVLGAEVDEPAVVGAQAGEAVLVVLGARRPGEEHERREERRHRVGEHDLADDALGLLLLVAQLGVPVAQLPLVAEVAVGVAVLAAPGVEVVAVGRVEVLAVLGVAPPGVTVGRDDGVAVRVGEGGHGVTSGSDPY